ncbi:acetyl-CoA C-acetyltransferase [Bacillaceae bacterium SIJ1]|uniref:acetyl-CoA C-acetyltransferase n=1 Tax=Litoribacterium kuwaitense TaxID=1398745 RepID=UPI0013E9BC2C|nr:acetyl-CoA C-acetyltransferase [Litoribacterium kuwaitense]NGP43822.1 acetyl-CoA C-acetyltransferase [Litoribacterium kuwaitense]
MKEVAIVSAVRTPIGTLGGAFKDITATDLGAQVIQKAVEKANIDPSDIDEVIMGNVLQAGNGQNPARQASAKAGIPYSVPAMTLNKVCGSGLKAVHLGYQAIKLGQAEAVVAGGMESMSQAPYLLEKARYGYRMGNGIVEDSLIKDGLWCSIDDCHMGITAEHLSKHYNISRGEQDEFAAESHYKANQAQVEGRFTDEIIPILVPQKKGKSVWIDQDEHPRKGVSIDTLAKLKPAFINKGTVTAGNSSGINDGAAAVVLMDASKARKRGIRILGVIQQNMSVGISPAKMGIAPVYATRKILARTDTSLGELDILEVNEAFAAQALAVYKELNLDQVKVKVNPNGGAIALGHPIGASGARILVTLIHEMKRQKARKGLATLCIGGGQGVATIIERENG